MAKAPQNKFKIVMLGDAGVGKTAIVNKFMYHDYLDKYEPTIGIDFFSKNVTLASGATVRLQLWDTAGQERFKSLTSSYIRDAAVALVVFDITTRQTLDGCRKWVSTVREKRGSEVIIGIVGNKSDLEHKRDVNYAEAKEYADSVGASYTETSALDGRNVNELFQGLAQTIASKEPSSTNMSSVSLTINNETPSKKKCGC
eukprot:Filipodium_phascolosomae@DN2138_c0_g1_i2.p1